VPEKYHQSAQDLDLAAHVKGCTAIIDDLEPVPKAGPDFDKNSLWELQKQN
jgi:hypothetical protein